MEIFYEKNMYSTDGGMYITVKGFLYEQGRQYTCKRNNEARSRNHFCREKAITIIYSESMSVYLLIQHAKRMSRITLLSVASVTLPYFSTLTHQRYDFWGKGLLNINWVFWFYLQILSEKCLVLRKIPGDIINVSTSLCKVHFILVTFSSYVNFLDIYDKNYY